MMKCRWVPTGLLLAALSLSACWGGAPKKEEAPPAHEEVGHEDEGHKEGEEAHNESEVVLAVDAQQGIGLATAVAARRPIATELVTTGEVEANANREAHVTTRVPGRVSAIYKNVGDAVRAGEPLAMLDSVALGEAQSAYLEALARQELARSTYERQRKLYQAELIAQKEVIAAQNQLRLAQIDVDKAKSQLRLYGYTAGRTATLASRRELDPTVPLLAPIAGVVLERHLTLGEMLEPGAQQPAFMLTDVSELWVNANLYERDLARVKVGQAATVVVPAFPGKTYSGRVSLISTALEKESRTAKARIVVTNGDRRLRPDMTATVRIAVDSQQTLAVPEAAIVQDAGEKFVFVRKDGTTFERRPVKVGAKSGEWVAVESGLQPGETVVTKGSFSLKSELMKESLGGHGH